MQQKNRTVDSRPTTRCQKKSHNEKIGKLKRKLYVLQRKAPKSL